MLIAVPIWHVGVKGLTVLIQVPSSLLTVVVNDVTVTTTHV